MRAKLRRVRRSREIRVPVARRNAMMLRPLFACPYTALASRYDAALGLPAFWRIRDAFERLVASYRISFRSAADVGCGTGLFACYLRCCWGVPMYAVDRSRAMLEQALRNCAGLDICFLEQDIRVLKLPRPVDLITANFDTLNHMVCDGDLPRAICRIAENLRPKGHFYFD